MGIFVGECWLRDLGQNLKVSHLLAKNLETKIIEGTVILPVWYGYGTLREEWRGGVFDNASRGNQFATQRK